MTNSIAQTIASQIGRQTFMMLGASELVAFPNGLQFKIKGSKKVNSIFITLEPTDTYSIQFWKAKKGSPELVKEETDVYVDNMHSVIESVTGLYTRLF